MKIPILASQQQSHDVLCIFQVQIFLGLRGCRLLIRDVLEVVRLAKFHTQAVAHVFLVAVVYFAKPWLFVAKRPGRVVSRWA